jgi:hypothetical protein
MGQSMQKDEFSASHLPNEFDYLAPEGSEIRLLPNMNGGGVSHCTLPAGKTSSAVRHKSVGVIWYMLSGEGEIWRKLDEQEEVTPLRKGTALAILLLPISNSAPLAPSHSVFSSPPCRLGPARMKPCPSLGYGDRVLSTDRVGRQDD